MDSSPVNWETLDALVLEFAKSEHLIEDNSTSSPSPSQSNSSSYHSRLLIRQIRRFIESGDIDSAVDLVQAHCPMVLDERLLFRLHKQKFIELLRRGTEEDRDNAISSMRSALAPSALNAYPEAYEEFKHLLLAFVYDKDDKTSPVAYEWSEKRKFELAGLTSSVLRANLQAYDPVFAMTVRYLISIHKGFCLHLGVSSPISDLTERLLLEERDPPAMIQESSYEVPPFDEADIQALAHAVELTRQGAVDSLRFAKGDLFQAFQNEVCRMRLDVTMLDELIHEYCVYRGIVDGTITKASSQEMQRRHGSVKVDQLDLVSSLSCNSSLEVECGANNHAVSEELSPESNAEVVNMQNPDSEERYPCDTSNHDDCSTASVSRQSEFSNILERNRIQGTGERNKRKRWRGRHEEQDLVSEVRSGCRKLDFKVTALGASMNILEEPQGSEISDTAEAVCSRNNKLEIVLAIKEAASLGMAAEVVEEINNMDPDFFKQNPTLLFQLKRIEFLKLVTSGDLSGALAVSCSHLGPLAAGDPALLKPLKETLLVLLSPNEGTVGELLPLCAIASSLQVAIGKRLGIEEPQLMKIIRATLHSHSEWFKLQMCKDPFESFVKIDLLKRVNSPLLADSVSKSSTDTCNNSSSQATVNSGSKMLEDGSSPDLSADEVAILKVMEWTSLVRSEAINLLAQYDGDAETAIQQYLSI